ncbi:MAG: aldo/keto reductase [Anaeromyxobacteraceae bacterium]
MRTRKLGNSGLVISEISLGSWLTYGGGVERARAEACLRRALDLGVNFIDTANVYAHGAAETFLGEALRDVPRARYVLATKLSSPCRPRTRGSPGRRSRSSSTPR